MAGLLFWLGVCCFVDLIWQLLDDCGVRVMVLLWLVAFISGICGFVIVVDLAVILFVWVIGVLNWFWLLVVALS